MKLSKRAKVLMYSAAITALLSGSFFALVFNSEPIQLAFLSFVSKAPSFSLIDDAKPIVQNGEMSVTVKDVFYMVPFIVALFGVSHAITSTWLVKK